MMERSGRETPMSSAARVDEAAESAMTLPTCDRRRYPCAASLWTSITSMVENGRSDARTIASN